MKPSKNKPAKKKNNPVVEKLLKLKYRINDVYRLIKEGKGKPKYDLTVLGDTRIDKQWVMAAIDFVRAGGTMDKSRMSDANKIWRKYD